jgi:protein TonB
MKKLMGGPILLSVLVHGAVVGAVMGWLAISPIERAPVENYVDLGYETLDVPPAPAEEVKKVMKSPSPVVPPEPKAISDNSPKEIQNEKGEVAGTQEAQKPNADIGSESTGTAATTPYYKIKPKYPKAALISGTEGWVLLEIDITEAGEVENIRVVGGEQRNLFQSEARRAVAQWKYRPFKDTEGHAIKKADHQVRVDFKLEEAGAGDEARL